MDRLFRRKTVTVHGADVDVFIDTCCAFFVGNEAPLRVPGATRTRVAELAHKLAVRGEFIGDSVARDWIMNHLP